MRDRGPNVVDVAEYARAVGLSQREIRRQCEEGVLPARKLGRTWAIAGEALTGPSTDLLMRWQTRDSRTLERMTTTIDTPEILATLAVLSRDNSFTASFGNGGKPDAIGTQNEAVWRAQAERYLLEHEKDGVPDGAWRVKQRQELLSRGDRLVAKRVDEKHKKYWADHKARAEEIQRAAFKWTEDEKLSIEENRKRRDEALEKHMNSHIAFALAQHQVQTQIKNGEFSAVPSKTVLEAESRAEIMKERPWLFAHLAPASKGGTAARDAAAHNPALARILAAPNPPKTVVHPAVTVARAVLAPRASTRAHAAAQADVDALAAELLTTYEANGATFPDKAKPAAPQAALLARCVFMYEPARREAFLSSIMSAAGIR